MHVQIVELSHVGHRMMHVRHVAEAFLPLVDRVTVSVTRDILQSVEFKTHVAPLSDRIVVDATVAAPKPTKSQYCAAWQSSMLLRHAVDRVNPDHVWLPTVDLVTQGMGMAACLGRRTFPHGVESEGIMHRCTPAYPGNTALRRFKLAMIAHLIRRAPWTRLHTVDHLAYDWMRDRGGPLALRARLLGDPVDPFTPLEKTEARKRLGIPDQGRYIGCSGTLDSHKGLHLLIPAFARAPLADDDRLLLVGRLATRLKKMIDGEFAQLVDNGRIVVIDRYVSDEQLMTSLAAMDVVCTPSAGHLGISNIALRAAAVHRPVLGCDFGWQGMILLKLGLGWVCAVEDLDVFARTIETCLGAAADFPLSPAIDRLGELHSIENYAASITQRMRERLGQPPAPNRRQWEWVLEAL